MQKLSRQILTEALWLTFSLVLTVLLALFLLGSSFLTDDLDLHLHDTYFIFSKWFILAPLFLFVAFIIYFSKTFKQKFSKTLSNWILLVLGLTLLISLTILIKMFSQFFIGGWTLYPPLSALGSDKIPEMTENPLTKFIANFLTVIQTIILFMLVFSVYRWGTNKQKQNREQ
jgi:heme/copper-type cytochrome/quinol oxidase subunit 1